MVTATELNEYLDEIRQQVCTHCVERPAGGPPCAPLGKQCGIELYLPELIDAIHGVDSASIAPYLANNRHRICEHCPRLGKGDCPCPMDYLAVLLVQAVETVDAQACVRCSWKRRHCVARHLLEGNKEDAMPPGPGTPRGCRKTNRPWHRKARVRDGPGILAAASTCAGLPA